MRFDDDEEIVATLIQKKKKIEIVATQTQDVSSSSGDKGSSSRPGEIKVVIINKTEAPLEQTKFKVMLELTGNESGNERPGLDLVTVLDVSGSMGGERMEKMKIAMQSVIRQLKPIDRLSVVTFSNRSNRLCPLRHMTENSQAEMEKLVFNLHARGGTKIQGGLEMGFQVLNNRRYTSGRVVAIMLLCDGDQNHGDVARVEVGNVPIYTFGLGVDYHPEALNKIANNSAGGTFSVIYDPNELTEAFSQCLAGLLTVAVQDLKVTFKQVNSTIENVSAGNYQQSNDVGSVTVSLGDHYEKDLRRVIVCLLLPAVTSTEDGTNVLEISYTYSVGGEVIYCPPRLVPVSRIGKSQEPEREEVKIEEIRLQTAQKIKNARIMADNKQPEDAMDLILEAHNLLDKHNNQLIERLKYELQQLLNSMETQDIYDKFGRAFALSCETSHDRQRFAAKGHIKSGPSSRTKVVIINKREAPLEETKFKVILKLTANEYGNNEKHGLDLVTILDVSSSMGGERMEKMKIAMQSVIRQLKPIDRLSVVTFSGVSKSLCPLSYMSKNYRGEIENLVINLKAQNQDQGGISSGLETGLKVLNDRMYTRGRVVAIMLLSDGVQNLKFGDATKVKVGNVPVYTFGLGTDTKLLKSIADNSNGGTFTNVQTLDNLSEAFSQCLARLHTVEVQDLKVTFKQVDSVIENVYAGNYPQSRDDNVDSVTVSFSNLHKEELHEVNVDLLLPDVSSTQCADILRISYKYSLGDELIHTNPLFVNITRRNSAMINEARVVTDKQLEVANEMISGIQKLLQNVVDETLNSEVRQLKKLMNSQKLYNEKESEEVTVDEIQLLTAESGEGTIRSLENYSTASHLGQASTVHSHNDLKKIPIEFLLDRTGVRQRIPEPLSRRNNYAEWSEKVKKYLEELNLWKVIEEQPTETTGSIENIDKLTAIKKLRQFRENWMASLLINQACGFPTNLQIIDLHSAREAWETLATNREQGSNVESFLSAAERDDWRTVESLLDSNHELATARIHSSRNTVLHLASLAGKVNIVKKLVDLTKEEDLEIQDKDGYTALANASINGNTKIAECMVRKNMKLVSIPNGAKLLPVVIAIMNGNKEMASYLYSVTSHEVLGNKGNINGATLLTYSIRLKFHDITFDLIQKYPRLAVALDHYGQSALYQLACAPSAFRSGSQLKFWQRLMYICVPVQHPDWEIDDTRLSVPYEYVSKSNWSNAGCRGILQQIVSIASRPLAVLGIKRIYEMKLVHHQSRGLLSRMYRDISDLDHDEVNGIINALHEAAAKGVVELIDEVLKKLPELRRFRDKQGSTIFMKAVEFRQERVFSLLQGFAYKDKMIDWFDDRGENILHKLKYNSVDKISSIQGAVLKMQKELQWLEDIKPIMSRDSIEKQNSEGNTAGQLFRESHKELMKNAEKWMYNTANSCIIVGVLVVTIMFAAAFTVPGGNENTGSPLFLRKKLFKVFIIADAVSLFSSTTSVLIFLGILSSRYAERDFLKSLPRKMIFGLFTLFLSMATMMITFAATLFMMLEAESRIILPAILSSLAVFPLLLYVGFLFPLLFEFTMSTYGPSIFHRKSKWWVFSFYLNKEVKWLLIG